MTFILLAFIFLDTQDQTMQHRMLGGGYTNMDNEYDQGYGMEPVIYACACVRVLCIRRHF